MTATRPQDLIESFLTEAWETTGELESAPFLMVHPDGMRRLVVASHRLKGSAGLYQYGEVSSLAGLLERVFESAHLFAADERRLALDFSAQVTAVLSEALERIQTTGDEGEPGLALAALGGGDLLQRLLVKNPTNFKRSEAQMGSSMGFIDELEPDLEAVLTGVQFEEPVVKTSSEPVVKTSSEPVVKTSSEPVVKTSSSQQVVDDLRHYFRNQPEVWEYFAPEVLENLELVAHGLETLDNQAPKASLDEMFRGFHTVKGASYSVGCEPLGQLAHRLEDALVLVRDGNTDWNDQFGNAVAQGIDALSRMIATAEGREVALFGALLGTHQALDLILGVQEQVPTPAPQIQLTPIAPAPVQTDTPEPTANVTLRVGLNRLERVLNLSGEVLLTRARFDNFSKRIEELNELLAGSRVRLERTSADITERFGNPKFMADSPEPETTNPAEPQSQLIEDVRAMFSELEFDRYDDTSLIARGVAELTADISELQLELEDIGRGFKRETQDFEKLTRSLRLEAGRLRLVPLSRLYQRLRRQVRTTAEAVSKMVKLELSGENVEIDNLVLENLVDPFTHLVNNAVIHGIEAPDVRRRSGKEAQGILKITAMRRGANLVLEVQDDGAGIDLAAVRRRAVERGLKSQDEVNTMTDEMAAELIFLPGLSTAKNVTDRAGRGVGMDVVASNIRRLKGAVSIQTENGFGTRFSLRIPANLIVSDILGIQVSGEHFAVPAETVRALRSLDLRDIVQTTLPDGSIERQFVLQGESFVLSHLADILELPRSINDTKRIVVMILESEVGRVAYEVDAMIGLEQAVVRQLDAPFDQIAHLSGASVSAEGDVILMLDPNGLAKLERGEIQAPSTVAAIRRTRMLLVDDSLSVRKVVSGLLTRMGCDVTTAADGEEALTIMTSEAEFDAIITDLEMPRKSGFELLDELRRRPAFAKLPVAMLTTRASDKHREFALALGVSEYFSKPIDETRLERFLTRVRSEVVSA
jgi:chemosensory pili system protein ChpA (sensor histidine kinase/response regulator)